MASLKCISVFAGAGISDVGFHQAGFESVAQVEIDRAANSVRMRHFPNAQHFKDIKDFDAREFRGVDAVFGGFPCQDYSVAGGRAGIDGDRGALWWEFHRVISQSNAQFIGFENVPGLLSSTKGLDFETIIASLVELGYCVAWRVLNLRYFRVPQRRRRVLIVGYLGKGRAAQIQFEPESLLRDFATGREAWEETSGDVAHCLRSSCPDGNPDVDTYVCGTLGAHQSGGWGNCLDHSGVHIPYLDSESGPGYWADADHVGTLRSIENTPSNLVCGTLRASAAGLNRVGGKANETDFLIPIQYAEQLGREKRQNGMGIGNEGDPMYTLETRQPHGVIHPIGFGHSNGLEVQPSKDAHCIQAGHDRMGAVAFTQNSRDEVREIGGVTGSLCANAGMKQQTYLADQWRVRRLTPVECERLMGLPDDFTRFSVDGSEISDSQRYRMLGNGWSVPQSRWQAERIMAIAKEIRA